MQTTSYRIEFFNGEPLAPPAPIAATVVLCQTGDGPLSSSYGVYAWFTLYDISSPLPDVGRYTIAENGSAITFQPEPKADGLPAAPVPGVITDSTLIISAPNESFVGTRERAL